MPGLDNFTKLLLHCDGADTSTTFTDSSFSGHTCTPSGNAQMDTAQSKFGGASVLFDGSGDYVTVADSADWDFGTGDFTIDYWVRFAALGSDRTAIDVNGGDGNGIWVQYQNAGNMRARIVGNDYTFAHSASTDIWYHHAITRSGTNLRMFVGGVQVGTTQTSSDNITGGTIGVLLGRKNGGGDQLSGWLDEVRISKGIARWTSTFDVPTAAYRRGSTSIVFFEEFNPG